MLRLLMALSVLVAAPEDTESPDDGDGLEDVIEWFNERDAGDYDPTVEDADVREDVIGLAANLDRHRELEKRFCVRPDELGANDLTSRMRAMKRMFGDLFANRSEVVDATQWSKRRCSAREGHNRCMTRCKRGGVATCGESNDAPVCHCVPEDGGEPDYSLASTTKCFGSSCKEMASYMDQSPMHRKARLLFAPGPVCEEPQVQDPRVEDPEVDDGRPNELEPVSPEPRKDMVMLLENLQQVQWPADPQAHEDLVELFENIQERMPRVCAWPSCSWLASNEE